MPYVNTPYLVEIVVGDPTTSVDGSVLAGYVFTTDLGELQVIHECSGRPDVYAWPLLAGPVLAWRLDSRRSVARSSTHIRTGCLNAGRFASAECPVGRSPQE